MADIRSLITGRRLSLLLVGIGAGLLARSLWRGSAGAQRILAAPVEPPKAAKSAEESARVFADSDVAIESGVIDSPVAQPVERVDDSPLSGRASSEPIINTPIRPAALEPRHGPH